MRVVDGVGEIQGGGCRPRCSLRTIQVALVTKPLNPQATPLTGTSGRLSSSAAAPPFSCEYDVVLERGGGGGVVAMEAILAATSLTGISFDRSYS